MTRMRLRLSEMLIVSGFELKQRSVSKIIAPVKAQPRSFSTARMVPKNSVLLFARTYSTRNIGIIAHIDAGKTTTTERMLYYAGITHRIGDVHHGDTITDYLPAERERGITITSAATTFHWADHKINLIDTPGHADFTFEVVRSIRVLDGAVTILDGVAGVEAQTEKVWDQSEQLNIPKIVYVNKMDRDGAGFGRTVREVVSKLKTKVAIVNIPYQVNLPSGIIELRGVIDVINQKLITYEPGSDGKEIQVIDVVDTGDDVLIKETLKARAALIETLSEINDELLEEFLEVGDYYGVSASSIKSALRSACCARQVVPVLCGSSFKNIGVQPLLDAVVDYLPAPEERPAPIAYSKITTKKGEIKEESLVLKGNSDNLACALAFKVVNDPKRGVLVFVRVYSGELMSGGTILNTSNGKKERIMKLLQMHANESTEISKAKSGTIAVIAGSKEIKTGDTLVARSRRKEGVSGLSVQETKAKLLPIEVPPPVFFAAIEPMSTADKKGMDEALELLLREDPSLQLRYDEESDQTLLAGMGELHLEIARDRLVNDLKARVEMGDIMVTYKETVICNSEEKISTVGTEYGDIVVSTSVGPNEGTGEVLDSDSNSFVYNIEEAVLSLRNSSTGDFDETIKIGVLPSFAIGGKIAHLPLHRVEANVHVKQVPAELESLTPLSKAVRIGLTEALQSMNEDQFAVMEPIMEVTVTLNHTEDIGVVMNDLTGNRRGQILFFGEDVADELNADDVDYSKLALETYIPPDNTLHLSSMSPTGSKVSQSIIRAHVPLQKMKGYLKTLRSMTQGRGAHAMHFDRFEIVDNERMAEIRENI